MPLNLEDTWIKAAIEHVILEIGYHSETKNETTIRTIEPDFIGYTSKKYTLCYYAIFCHLRHEGPKCFQPGRIFRYRPTGEHFEPSPLGRWTELQSEYDRKGLAQISFN